MTRGGGRTRSGRGNIDLRGAPFAVVPDAFVVTGDSAGGSPTYSARNQVVDLVGGGSCGWIAPRRALFNPTDTRGGFDLDLDYVGL